MSIKYLTAFSLLFLACLQGCAVASATAGAAISVVGSAASAAIGVTGAVIEAAVSDDDKENK